MTAVSIVGIMVVGEIERKMKGAFEASFFLCKNIFYIFKIPTEQSTKCFVYSTHI